MNNDNIKLHGTECVERNNNYRLYYSKIIENNKKQRRSYVLYKTHLINTSPHGTTILRKPC